MSSSLTFGSGSRKWYSGSIRTLLALTLTICAAVPAAAVVRDGTGVGPIADGTSANACNAAPLDVVFAISGQATPIGSMTVSFTGTHTWVGDLRVSLIAPNATTHLLFDGVGRGTAGSFGDSSNLSGTYLFGDASTLNIWQQATGGADAFIVPAGNYRTQAAAPFTPVNPGPALTLMTPVFSGLSDAQANGNWILRFLDCGVGDLGNITAARLSLFGPTAAGASISGRVVTADGRGVANASISVVGGMLETPRSVITNPFGYFRFEQLPAGQTYILTASSKRFFISNAVETITLTDDFDGLTFRAEPY